LFYQRSRCDGGIGIKCESGWVWKWDCGTESKTDAEKGEASDSFKRAAVKWGVGRFLYELGIKRLSIIKYKDKNYPLNESTGKAIFDKEELTSYINGMQKKTTLYNHKELGNKEKPLIENRHFKALCEAIEKGDVKAYDRALAKVSFAPQQVSIIEGLLKQTA